MPWQKKKALSLVRGLQPVRVLLIPTVGLQPAQIIADAMTNRNAGNMNRLINLRHRITTYVELCLVIGTVVEDPKAVGELP